MYNTIIFDLDGTLLNTLQDLADACNYALKENGFPTHNIEEYKIFLGYGRDNLIRRIIPKEYLEDEEVIYNVLDVYDKYYILNMRNFTRPYDGILELLDELNDKEVNIAVLSNKPEEYTTEVVKHYFGDTFKLVYGLKNDVPGKPDPTAVFTILNELNVETSQCIFIGDSNIDIRTAKNAKTCSIGVTWGFRTRNELEEEHADYIVESVDQLKKLVFSLL